MLLIRYQVGAGKDPWDSGDARDVEFLQPTRHRSSRSDPSQINDAYDRTVKSDVKYRFIIDAESIHQSKS